MTKSIFSCINLRSESKIYSENQVLGCNELNEQADIWASYIFQFLGGDASLWPNAIPIISDRSVEYIKAVLACWKLGIGVVPIAIGTPHSRLMHIIQDLDCKVVINLTKENLPEHINQLKFDENIPDSVNYPEKPLNKTGVAYIIYTSGTTGAPKGCVVGIESLIPIIESFVQHYRLNSQCRVTFCANIAFDAAMLEWLPALSVGGSVYLVSDDTLLNSQRLVEFYRNNDITFSWLPTPIAELLMADDEIELPASLQVLQTAGQRLSRRPPKNWSVRVENAYGPTETTVIATSGVVHSIGSGLPDIGKPLPGIGCFVVDDNLKSVPAGEIGELIVTGIGVSRGYLKKSELNEKSFVEFISQEGKRLRSYRTGDLCRFNTQGNIEYITRKDKQLKINGYRIESDEIIHHLLNIDNLQQAHIMIRRVGQRDVLVAYVVMREWVEKNYSKIRDSLAQNLPSYMIPTYIMALEHFPLTANHKIDEEALPLPKITNLKPAAEEDRLASNERDFLALFRLHIGGAIGWNEDFYQAGGNSIAAISISAQVYKKFSLTLPFELFKSHGTPEKIWQVIQSNFFDVECIGSHLDTKKSYVDTPLSSSQRSIWFFANIDPEDRAYHAKSQLLLYGDVNAQAVAFAIQKVVDRHSIFRSTFISGDGEGVQRVHQQYQVKLAEFDFSDLSPEQSEQNLQEVVQKTLNQPFNLAQLPLVRWGLVKLPSNKSALVHIEHHLVHDGWSYNLFLKDFLFYYRTFVEGSSAELEFPSQYADYCITQAKWLKSSCPEQDLVYWKQQLGDASSVLNLPSHHTDSDDVRSGQTLRIQLPRHKWAAVEKLAEKRAETPFSIMLAAYYVMLSRFSSDSDICVGSAFANRQWINADSIIGMMINTVAMRFKLDNMMTLEDVLSGTSRVVQEAQRHQSLPFEYLVNAINPERSVGVNPFFQVFFGFHDSPMPELILPGIKHSKVLEAIDSQAAKFDLSVVVIPRKGQVGDDDPVHVLWEFKRARFPKWLIENMIEDYLGVLDCLLATPNLLLVDLKVNTPRLSGPEQPFKSNNIYKALVKQSELTPQAIALSCQETNYSYTEIVQEVKCKAAYLANLGVKPNCFIGISIARDSNFLLWMLACQATGVGYIPIDPEYPVQRKQYILEHSKINYLISDEAFANVDRIDPLAFTDTEFTPVDIDGQWPMYCIYTSGSTGLPKGVVISYSAFSNFIQAMKQQFQLNEQHKWLAITSFSFDISTLEVYLPLICGAQVQLATQQESRDLTRLIQSLESDEITHCQATPSFWHALSALGWQPHSQQCILTGGEALDATLAKVLSQNGNLCFNMYGPTETTVWSSVKPIWAQEQVISLGKPIANTQFWILDEHMKPVPVGAVGELWISGASLATGYLHNAHLTRERFVYNEILNQRLYKTGDLVSLDNDGELFYFGRKDHQVKVSGHRIELEEIEQVMKQLEQVQQVAVVTRVLSGTTQIVAFVNSSADEALLREHCCHKLPTYMVPNQFLYLDALPLTPNNKIDRKALPEQGLQNIPEEHVALNKTEALIAAIWQEILGIEHIGPDAHFYQFGGNSLQLLKVHALLVKALATEFDVSICIKNLVLSKLGVALEQIKFMGIQSEATHIQYHDLLPLTAQQKSMYLAYSKGGTLAYNVPFFMPINIETSTADIESLLSSLVKIHPALGMKVVVNGGHIYQQYVGANNITIPMLRVSFEEWEECKLRYSAKLIVLEEQVLKAALISVDSSQLWLALSIHHIAIDGQSIPTLLDTIKKLLIGKELKPNYGFISHVHWQQSKDYKILHQKQVDYWTTRLASLTNATNLPYQYTSNKHRKAAIIDVSMGIDLMIGAKSLAKKLKITEFSFWSGVTAYVLGRLNQHSYATILTPVSKRMNLNESESVGYFSNTILLYANWDEQQTVEQFLSSWQQHATDDFCNALVTLDEIYVARTSQGAHLGGRPEVMFSLAEQNSNSVEIGSNDEVKFDLRITLNNSSSAPSLRLEYLNSAYSRHMITSFAGILSYVAQQILSDQDTELGQLKLSVSELSGERLCGNKRVAIPQVILDTAQLDGDKIALSDHESQYSYTEVISKAKSIAAYLQTVDIKKGDRVAVLMGRHCGLPITLLGVLLSGATYVPLDPDYPMSRTEYILNDVEPRIVICDEKMTIGSEGIHWCEYSSLANFSSDLYQSVEYDKDDISHLIYTSGSTGQPKGVMVRHGGVLALFDWAKGYYQAEEFSLVYGGTSMCFDLSIFEVFVTWAIGGRLHLAANALQLVEDLASYPISLINTVPSVLAEVLKHASLSSSIRVINLAGEPLPPRLAQDIYRMSDHLRVINLYGPSEDTTYSTFYQVPRDNTEDMRIGSPLDGTKVKVVDKYGRTMPPHYSGELYISGEGLALGYWNRTELTQEKFCEDDQQTRWYQTGDIVTVGDDGLLIYQGRIDNQVKLNGFRIELDEIDNLLLSLSFIKNACTILQKGERQSRMVSFVETDSHNGLAIAKHLLLEQLPAYMLPSEMIVIAKIPTTLSGKQDRTALQKLLNEEKRQDKPIDWSVYPAPVKWCADLYCELLAVASVLPNDDFVSAGGNSLSVISIIKKVNAEYGIEVSFADVFKASTPKTLGMLIEQLCSDEQVCFDGDEIII